MIFKMVWCSKSLQTALILYIAAIFLCVLLTLFIFHSNARFPSHLKYKNVSHNNSEADCPRKETQFNKTVFNISLNPPGSKSYVFIHTANYCNKVKVVGGDFWWVKLMGPVSFNVPLIDNNSGIYSREFWLPMEGNYTMSIMLEFSNFNGLKDPPKNWFKKGDYQGRRQDERYFSKEYDYILEFKIFHFDVKTGVFQPKDAFEQLQSWHFQPFCIVNQAHGYWIKNKYVTVTADTENFLKQKLVLKHLLSSKRNATVKPTFWFYGDSMTLRFSQPMSSTQLCSDFICELTYTWTYPLKNNYGDPKSPQFDDKDFNQTEFLDYIKDVILKPSMRNNDSVLLINFGLHILKNINMSQAEELMDAFITIICEMKASLLSKGFPKIIWKTTTPAYIEKFFLGNERNNLERYLIKQRAIQWNSYCVKKMCENNFPVLDVYWMAASYPNGPDDSVHYPNHVFFSAADFLLDVFT